MTQQVQSDDLVIRQRARSGALAAVGLGAYMAALSGSVVSAILPLITNAFNTDVATIEWVIVVFLLVQSGLLLSFGRLGDMYGHHIVYAAGLVVYIGASVLCGLAPTVYVLIGARVLQGIGGAMLFSTSSAIVTRAFPAEQRGRALGMQSTSVYLGLATGPPLGGWLADVLTWRAVFFISVPFGLLCLFLALRYIPRDQPPGRGERFDLLGAATYIVGLITLLLALNQGHAWGWTSPAVLGCTVVGLILLGLFSTIELRVPSPMLDLGLFRRRAFSAPVLSAVLNYMGVSTTFLLVPFYLLEAREMSPTQAGLILIAQPIVMAVTALFSGSFSDRVGSRLPSTLGMVVLAGGLFLMSRADVATPLAAVIVALAIVGLGIGLFTAPNNSAVMGAVPAGRRGVAAGILATARTLGNVLGIGVAGAIFSTVLAGRPHGTVEIAEAAGAGMLAAAGLALLGAVVSATRPERDAPG